MTLLLTLVAVPINTVVGITAAINITRNEFPGKTLLIAMLDLPFSISPVVTGVLPHRSGSKDYPSALNSEKIPPSYQVSDHKHNPNLNISCGRICEAALFLPLHGDHV